MKATWTLPVVAVAIAALAFTRTGVEPIVSAAHQLGSARRQHRLYAFVARNATDKVTLIANFIPFEAPYGAARTSSSSMTTCSRDHGGQQRDASKDVTFQFRFRTDVRNQNTFLYNTGSISLSIPRPSTCVSCTR